MACSHGEGQEAGQHADPHQTRFSQSAAGVLNRYRRIPLLDRKQSSPRDVREDRQEKVGNETERPVLQQREAASEFCPTMMRPTSGLPG